MGKPQIISEEPMSMVELKEEIKKIKKRDKEPSFRVGKMEEYLNIFVNLTPEQEKELEAKINKLNIPRLKSEHIKKIIDILPINIEQLKVVLQGYTITVNQENMKKIIAVVSEYLPKKKGN